jgi:O-antigen/teichoic acid export membrane protein
VLQSFLTNIGLTGLNVISGVLLARMLGPVGRGELAAIQALPLIVTALGQLGLNEAVIYFGGRDRERVGRYSISACLLTFITGVPIVLGCALLTPRVLSEHSPEVILASQLFLGMLFLNALDGVAIASARALHRIALWNVLRTLPRVMWVVMVVAYFVVGNAAPGRIALTYLVLHALLIPFLIWAVRDLIRPHWKPVPALWPQMLKYGLPVAAGVAPRMLNERLDQLVVAAMLPPAELGLYAVAVAWTGLAQLPAMTITAVALSKITGMRELDAQLSFIRKAVLAVAVTATLASLALALATPWVIPFVFGEEFVGATSLAYILLVAVVVRGIAWMIQVGAQGIGKPMVGMISQWVGLGMLVPMAAVLIPQFGASGAAWSLVAASGATLVCASILGGRAASALRASRSSG